MKKEKRKRQEKKEKTDLLILDLCFSFFFTHTDLLSAHLRVEISFHQMRTGTTVHTNRQTGCSQFRDPTTSFLTATNLIYAIGAGITAAAGTRLALQLLLIKGFKLYSFQLQGPYWDLYCYFLSLPPCIRIG